MHGSNLLVHRLDRILQIVIAFLIFRLLKLCLLQLIRNDLVFFLQFLAGFLDALHLHQECIDIVNF